MRNHCVVARRAGADGGLYRKRMAEEQDRFVLGDEEDESPPGYSSDPEAETHSAKALTPNSEAEDEVPEVQTVTHNLCRGDTLLSISRRYAVDVS